MQTSVEQALPSSQLTGDPPQVPLVQWSPTVQTLRSLHAGPVCAVCPQPDAGLQVSAVQELSSLQLTVLPTQLPPGEQVSPVVQALLSLHDPVMGVCAHPDAGLQVSRVHALLSSQFGTVCVHWCEVPSQPSVVQTLLSLQITASQPVEQEPRTILGVVLVPLSRVSSDLPVKERSR